MNFLSAFNWGTFDPQGFRGGGNVGYSALAKIKFALLRFGSCAQLDLNPDGQHPLG
jgi:hypothetical protein